MFDLDAPSPESVFPATLASLSRNASAISSSSSDSIPVHVSLRGRPFRTFSAPRSISPNTNVYRGHELYFAQENVKLQNKQFHGQSRSKSGVRHAAVSVDDFEFGITLGEGSYSTVKLATHLRSNQQYAVKILEKSHLMRKDKLATALAEKNALVALGAGHPGIIRLYYTFQDEWRLYFVIDLARNGEMQTLISRLGSLSLECARYYGAQIVDAIGYMHSKGVIHRDLKPENILLDDHYRIKIADFGTGKILDNGVEKAATWVGTAQYIAPELLDAKETSKSSDFWALGCIIYQMIAGRFAFQGMSEYLTWQKIKHLDYSFPDGFDDDAQDVVRRLFVREPTQRLGVGHPDTINDMNALRSHSFFSSIVWDTLWDVTAPPIQSGLVKNENSIAQGIDRNWEDIGAIWDDLVGDGNDDDDIEWDPSHNKESLNFKPPEEINKSAPSYALEPEMSRSRRSEEVEHDMKTCLDSNLEVSEMALPPPTPSHGTGTSSSERSSSIMNVDSMIRTLSLDKTPLQEADDRGRKQLLSPMQANGSTSDIILAALKLSAAENILYSSSVEARSLRRRTSRLMPLSIPPGKFKSRQLLLTSQRLICLKQQRRANDITIKTELIFRGSGKCKLKEKDEKESQDIVVSVERKGEMEFAVFTPTRTFIYAAKDGKSASAWMQHLEELLEMDMHMLPEQNK